MDLSALNYSSLVAQNQPTGCKRKCADCTHKVQGLYFRDQPIREGKKRFWIDLFYEKTGIELERGLKKVCYVVRQDHVPFVLLKSKLDMSKKKSATLLESFYQEREIQLALSKYEGFVSIIDSFLLPSRKNKQVIKWISIAEKYDGDFTKLTPELYPNVDSYLLQIALRVQEIIKERIVIPDFKLDNLLFRGNVATITDFGSAHFVDAKPTLISMTMGYLSPERSRSSDGGFSGMIFALGICMAMLAYKGKIPYPSENLEKRGAKWIDADNQTQYKGDVVAWKKKLPPNKYRQLIVAMTNVNPTKRPDIGFVVERIRNIVLTKPN